METFCLIGFKAMMFKPFLNIPISRKMDWQDIQNGIIHFHTQKSNPFTAPHPPNINAQKLLIGQCHDCLSLATFRAIERAYEEREKEEGLRERAKRVVEVQNHRDGARGRCKRFEEAQRIGLLLRQEQERVKLEKTLKLQRTKQEQEVQLVHQKYIRFLTEKQRNMMEQETVKHFSQQHGALTKAFSKRYRESRFSETERRRHITIGTQPAGSQTVQGLLKNRYSNLNTWRTGMEPYTPGEH